MPALLAATLITYALSQFVAPRPYLVFLAAVMLATILITVFVDLITAVEVGMVMASFLFVYLPQASHRGASPCFVPSAASTSVRAVSCRPVGVLFNKENCMCVSAFFG